MKTNYSCCSFCLCMESTSPLLSSWKKKVFFIKMWTRHTSMNTSGFYGKLFHFINSRNIFSFYYGHLTICMNAVLHIPKCSSLIPWFCFLLYCPEWAIMVWLLLKLPRLIFPRENFFFPFYSDSRIEYIINVNKSLLLLLSHFSRVWLCVTP